MTFDTTPIWVVAVLFILLSLIAYEVGFRLGRWWQERTPGEQEGPTGVLVGSLLALLAFLLAIAMGMASDRFDARRGLVITQANALLAVYLQAGYLPEPANDQIRNLMREYVPLQIGTTDEQQLRANLARSDELEDQMWSITENVARSNSSDVIALFVDNLTNVFQVHDQRVNAALNVRVPNTILWLLIGGALLSLGMVGFGAGVTEHRSVITAVVLIVALGATIMLVLDLDQPRQGFIMVSQQPLTDLIQEMGPTP